MDFYQARIKTLEAEKQTVQDTAYRAVIALAELFPLAEGFIADHPSPAASERLREARDVVLAYLGTDFSEPDTRAALNHCPRCGEPKEFEALTCEGCAA